MRYWEMILATSLVFTMGACRPTSAGTSPPTVDNAGEQAEDLNAVLFGYIPDAGNDEFEALKTTLEEEFEAYARKREKHIDLHLQMDENIDLYDLKEDGELARLFGDGDGAADVLELDMVLLQDLVGNGWIAPTEAQLDRFVPASRDAVVLDGIHYGIPTYLCGNFIYSLADGLAAVDTASALLKILTEAAGPRHPALVGNYDGSWTLPAFYLDAWADGHSNAPDQVRSAYQLPLDEATMNPLGAVVSACTSPVDGSPNPCIDGTYKYNTKAESAFAKGEAGGFVGYSERLFYILSERPEPLPKVISAPMGEGSNPLLFVDALVTSTRCTDSCRENAELFIEFMSSLKVRQLIAFSRDASKGTPPRYLLQALTEFYEQEPASNDPIYSALWETVVNKGQPFPNQGFPEARTMLNDALERALRAP